MTVKRITAAIATEAVGEVQEFYADLFGLAVAMDLGWIVTLSSDERAPIQLNIAQEGGSGAPVPALSIEVDDVDALYAAAQARGCAIAYPLTDEPWGVRRFYLRDPAGTLINVLAHSA